MPPCPQQRRKSGYPRRAQGHFRTCRLTVFARQRHSDLARVLNKKLPDRGERTVLESDDPQSACATLAI
jgi:hypothetical protein